MRRPPFAIVPLALALFTPSLTSAEDRGFVVIGGPSQADVALEPVFTTEREIRATEILSPRSTRRVVPAFLSTGSRVVDARALAESAVVVSGRQITAESRPAVKPQAQAFLRPDRGESDADTDAFVGELLADEVFDDAEPGWGELRIDNPEGRDRVYRIGTPTKSSADDARDDRSADVTFLEPAALSDGDARVSFARHSLDLGAAAIVQANHVSYRAPRVAVFGRSYAPYRDARVRVRIDLGRDYYVPRRYDRLRYFHRDYRVFRDRGAYFRGYRDARFRYLRGYRHGYCY